QQIKKFNHMKIITHFVRIIVGVLFILSGLIKLNDPMGLSFKLDEYFSEEVFNMPFLQPYSLALALIVIIAEIVLGVMLLLGHRKKFTLTSLFLMIVFFTFLTFFSAYYNKVTDCGCFGDAIKLTPWESFTKDVVLLVLILILMVQQKYIHPLFNNSATSSGITVLSLIFSGAIAYYVINHLPLIDFRAYKVGTNIPEGMAIPDDKPKPVYEINFIYNVNGEEKVFSMNDLANLPEGAEYVSRDERLIEKGYEPPIFNFTIEKDGADYKDDVLAQPKALIFTSYDLEKANESGILAIKEIAQKAESLGYLVIGLTASNNELIENIRSRYGLSFDYYFCDGVTIKTIERANPSIIKLEYGTIVDKKHWKDAEQLSL